MTDTIYTDEDGMLFRFVASYTYKGEVYGLTLWAESLTEAQRRLLAIGENGMINGRLIEELPLKQGGHSDG